MPKIPCKGRADYLKNRGAAPYTLSMKKLLLPLALLAACGRAPTFEVGNQGIVQNLAILPLPEEVDEPNHPLYVVGAKQETLLGLDCTLNPAPHTTVTLRLLQEAQDSSPLPDFGLCDVFAGTRDCGAVNLYRAAFPGSRIYLRVETGGRRSIRVTAVSCALSVRPAP